MEEKLGSIRVWPRPQNVFDFRSFLGLCGFYWHYVRNFAMIAAPLHDLTAGNVTKRQPVQWLLQQELDFQQLKEALVSAPVLLMHDKAKPYVMETESLDITVGAVLLQSGNDALPTQWRLSRAS
jgi:hypothetical protein